MEVLSDAMASAAAAWLTVPDDLRQVAWNRVKLAEAAADRTRVRDMLTVAIRRFCAHNDTAAID